MTVKKKIKRKISKPLKKKKKISPKKKLPIKKKIIKTKKRSLKFKKLNKIFSIPIGVNIDVNFINYEGCLSIDGTLSGNIKVGSIILGKTGKLIGTITCKEIKIYGECQADLFIKNNCEIYKSSKVKGNINYDNNLYIEKGSNILGELIPKKKPLALPNYYNHPTKLDDIDNDLTKQKNIQAPNVNDIFKINTNNTFKKNTLDKIISKIFK